MSSSQLDSIAAAATRRLRLLAIALLALTGLIGALAVFTWWGVAYMRRRFDLGQIATYRIAEELQNGVRILDSRWLSYESARRPEDWRLFEEESRRFGSWIAVQRVALAAAPEQKIVTEMQAAYDRLKAAADLHPETPLLGQIAQVRAQEAELIQLGLRLAYAHRETLHTGAVEQQDALIRMQAVILGAQLAGMLLSGLAAWITYRQMVAPLRVELLESEALVARSEKLAALGVLAAGVAHEIRNPLTAIKARLFTLKKALAPASRERDGAELIGREIDRLEKIVSEFLRFARPVEPERRPLAPRQVLRELVELLSPRLRESSIELTVEQATETWITADPEQLTQVLINLVNNAAEAMENHGAIRLRAIDSQFVLEGRSRAVVSIEVEDNGPGIPVEARDRLFDPFFSTKPTGSGLGLSIAARIVEKHGGVIRVQNASAGGALFQIILPLDG